MEEVISPIVTEEDNLLLTRIPSLEEVGGAVFSLNVDGAPEPDGFEGIFFHKFWDLVANDVFNAVNQFFCHNCLLPNFNSNMVIVIPKVSGADKVE